jgi:hypothetical protein
LEEALAIAVSLGTQTTEAGRFEQLDYALRSNSFYAWLKSASAAPRIHDEYSELANGAADALDAVQTQFRFFAVRGGETWRYGQLPQSTPVTHRSRRLPVDAMTRKQHQLGRSVVQERSCQQRCSCWPSWVVCP